MRTLGLLLGLLLTAIAFYQVIIFDDISQPLVSIALGFALGWLLGDLINEVL
jgi:hypothetical protein